MGELESKIKKAEKRVAMLDATIASLRKPAWGHQARLKACITELNKAFTTLRALAEEV